MIYSLYGTNNSMPVTVTSKTITITINNRNSKIEEEHVNVL
jgi:hypothetical protein